jgi:hypothetical protein
MRRGSSAAIERSGAVNDGDRARVARLDLEYAALFELVEHAGQDLASASRHVDHLVARSGDPPAERFDARARSATPTLRPEALPTSGSLLGLEALHARHRALGPVHGTHVVAPSFETHPGSPPYSPVGPRSRASTTHIRERTVTCSVYSDGRSVVIESETTSEQSSFPSGILRGADAASLTSSAFEADER